VGDAIKRGVRSASFVSRLLSRSTMLSKEVEWVVRRDKERNGYLPSHNSRGRCPFRASFALIIFISIGFVDNLFGDDFLQVVSLSSGCLTRLSCTYLNNVYKKMGSGRSLPKDHR